jgi:aspartate/methionine/tyrosine aminotransferase
MVYKQRLRQQRHPHGKKAVSMIGIASPRKLKNRSVQGCIISQANIDLRTAMKLQVTTEISSLAAVATAGLLTSTKLTQLIETSNERLSRAYAMVTSWLEQHSLPYLTASHGIFVYARLAPAAQTWADEDRMIKAVRQAGVLVSSGRSFHEMQTHVGWARIIIAVDLATLAEALTRVEKALGLEGTVPQA